jgi:hypothetical protein
MKRTYRLTPLSGAIHEKVTVARLLKIFQAFMKPNISIALKSTTGPFLKRKNSFISFHRLQNRYHYKGKSKTIPVTGREDP